MTSQRLTRRVVLAGAVLGLAATTNITITPASHDFGKFAVNGSAVNAATFQISVPAGGTPANTVRIALQGADAGEFMLGNGNRGPTSRFSQCPSTAQGPVCNEFVDFRPTSLGIKTATLVVTDSRGYRATAQIKGEGVAALCEMKVVFCNYAHLYSGTFIWTSGSQGPAESSNEHVQVDVVRGIATCNGTSIGVEHGVTSTGTITGSGLIAIEFEKDAANRPVYRITVACPTPAFPASPDGSVPAIPSQPAELGHNEQKSYDQPATRGVGATLMGSYSTPYSDPVNGHTGNSRVSWEFCDPIRYRIVPNKVCV